MVKTCCKDFANVYSSYLYYPLRSSGTVRTRRWWWPGLWTTGVSQQPSASVTHPSAAPAATAASSDQTAGQGCPTMPTSLSKVSCAVYLVSHKAQVERKQPVTWKAESVCDEFRWVKAEPCLTNLISADAVKCNDFFNVENMTNKPALWCVSLCVCVFVFGCCSLVLWECWGLNTEQTSEQWLELTMSPLSLHFCLPLSVFQFNFLPVLLQLVFPHFLSKFDKDTHNLFMSLETENTEYF